MEDRQERTRSSRSIWGRSRASGSIERIDNSPIEKLLVTDTVENQPVEFSDKIEFVSVAD